MPAERREQAIAVELGSTGSYRDEPETFSGRRQPSCDGTSRMTRECQVRICERPGVKFPGPTRQRRASRRMRRRPVLPVRRSRVWLLNEKIARAFKWYFPNLLGVLTDRPIGGEPRHSCNVECARARPIECRQPQPLDASLSCV